ncbi:MAG TPA: hypothetical protein VFG23_08445 [Polyangia bacterium]|nr:hypothetical protein [Polyangia bacterium]
MSRPIVVSIAPEPIAERAVRLVDELTLARSELSAAHAYLDDLGVPRYAHTDYPLPLAQRVRYLVEFGPKQGTG